MGLMGTAGTLSIYFVLPEMGKIFDNKKIEAAGGEAAFKALSGDALTRVLALASQESFRKVAILHRTGDLAVGEMSVVVACSSVTPADSASASAYERSLMM